MTAASRARTLRWLLGPSLFVRSEQSRWLQTRPVQVNLIKPRVRGRRPVRHRLRAGPVSDDGTGDPEPAGVGVYESHGGPERLDAHGLHPASVALGGGPATTGGAL